MANQLVVLDGFQPSPTAEPSPSTSRKTIFTSCATFAT